MSMARRYTDLVAIRLEGNLNSRITSVLRDDESRSDLIRAGTEREVRRREAQMAKTQPETQEIRE
jgi:hypothetical protein